MSRQSLALYNLLARTLRLGAESDISLAYRLERVSGHKERLSIIESLSSMDYAAVAGIAPSLSPNFYFQFRAKIGP